MPDASAIGRQPVVVASDREDVEKHLASPAEESAHMVARVKKQPALATAREEKRCPGMTQSQNTKAKNKRHKCNQLFTDENKIYENHAMLTTDKASHDRSIASVLDLRKKGGEGYL